MEELQEYLEEQREKDRQYRVVFSRTDPLDVALWDFIEANRGAGKRVNVSGLIKKLMYDWLLQSQLHGTIAPPPIPLNGTNGYGMQQYQMQELSEEFDDPDSQLTLDMLADFVITED
jgi:hypothetical protein